MQDSVEITTLERNDQLVSFRGQYKCSMFLCTYLKDSKGQVNVNKWFWHADDNHDFISTYSVTQV
jgi:hypothetical protein